MSASDWVTFHAPYKISNIGSNKPIQLMGGIETIMDAIYKKNNKNIKGTQNGGMLTTQVILMRWIPL